MENKEMTEKEILDLLQKQHIYAHDPVAFTKGKGQAVGVVVRTALPEGAEVKTLNWNIEIRNKNGCSIYLSDWKVSEEGQRQLSFIAWMSVPDTVDFKTCGFPRALSTSFVDLLWFQGNETVDKTHKPTIETEISGDYGDLGWHLPSRFVDRLVDALGKANDVFLSGMLEDACLLGILTR